MDQDNLETQQVAEPALNFCDRVEIFSDMIHNGRKPLDMSEINQLLESHYPSLVHLCEDLRGDRRVADVQAFLDANSARFEVVFQDKTTQSYTYNEIDTEI